MDVRDFRVWLETPAGRVYAATHGGRAVALAQCQADAAAELKRLRDATRDHEMEYPEPEPGYLAAAADDAGQALALYESAMERRRRAHTEQMRFGPAVRLETGPSMAGTTEDIAARLRRENPLWGVETGTERPDRAVKMGTPDGAGGIVWSDVDVAEQAGAR